MAHAIGQRLQIERKRLGLTQVEMAAALGVSRLTVLGYEAGRATPSLELVARTDVPLDVTYLVTGERLSRTDESWSLLRTALEVLRSSLQRHGVQVSPEEEADVLRELFLKVRREIE
jgi:transcriptional regulator with XRE-family HTH domain